MTYANTIMFRSAMMIWCGAMCGCLIKDHRILSIIMYLIAVFYAFSMRELFFEIIEDTVRLTKIELAEKNKS